MEVSVVGIPIPLARSTISPGDMFTLNYNVLPIYGLRVQSGSDSLCCILSGWKALGLNSPDLVEMNALPDKLATYPGPFKIYALPEPSFLIGRDPPNGSLWLDRSGAAFVRVTQRLGGVAYFSLADGQE